MNKIDKATNDIINSIRNKKNENLIKEHIGQINFRNEIVLESHFDSLQEGVADMFKGKVDAVKVKLDKTKYSPAKKALIMQVLKKQDFDPHAVDIVTATSKDEMDKAVMGFKKMRGASAFTNLISNMKALGLG